jgi:hypothetical protein
MGQRVYLAPRETKIPARNLPRVTDDSQVPAGWLRYQNWVNGLTVNFNNPMEPFPTSDNGIIATFPSGADSITITGTSRTPTMQFLKWKNGFAKIVKAATTATTTEPAYPAAEVFNFDPTEENRFMLWIEGWSDIDGLYDTARIVRFIAPLCRQGGTNDNRADKSGNDGNLQPGLELTCEPETTARLTAITASTGFEPADFGAQRKHMWANVAVA